jgi:hypothetical protein
MVKSTGEDALGARLRRSEMNRSRRCWSSGLVGTRMASRRGSACFIRPRASCGRTGSWYKISNSCRRTSLSFWRSVWPLHTLWRRRVAASSSRSRCLLSRSTWAWATVLDAPDCVGVQLELAQGFVLRCPLRSTLRGRRDEPEKLGNIMGGLGRRELYREGDVSDTALFENNQIRPLLRGCT